MSVGKFVAGTTLATPAIGGVSYVTYEQLTKEETETKLTEDREAPIDESASSKTTGRESTPAASANSADLQLKGAASSADEDASKAEINSAQSESTDPSAQKPRQVTAEGPTADEGTKELKASGS